VPGSTVELFSDGSDEGDVLEAIVTAGPDGRFEFAASQPFVGPDMHATNTDALGNTSEFGGEGVPPPSVTPRPTSQVNGALLLPIVLKNEILFTELALEPATANVPMGAIHSLALRVRGAVHLYGAQIELVFDPPAGWSTRTPLCRAFRFCRASRPRDSSARTWPITSSAAFDTVYLIGSVS
jgi:hypothetical protein